MNNLKTTRALNMEKDAVQRWLDQYGQAWRSGNPEKATSLFSESAMYHETPFEKALNGREMIRQYWQEGAADSQENVEFQSQVWMVEHKTAIAGWQARFTRKGSGIRVVLDGVFRLEFSQFKNHIICEKLEEWWHRKEI